MIYLNEDTLVQQTTANYLRDQLGWESVYAYNQETYGSEGLLGRNSDREVVLTRYLRQALEKLNPDLPAVAYEEAVRQVINYSQSQSLLANNFDKYKLFKDGVPVSFQNEHGEIKKERLRVFDFEDVTNNHFLAVRELWVQGDLYRRRIDIAGFVNGIPLLFIECKNIHKDLKQAYERNLADYKDTIPHFFHHNAIIMLANGEKAKVGTVTAGYEHFHEWKRLSESDIQKFNQDVDLQEGYTKRPDIIVITDEAHRTQYGILALNMRNALPNANFIGFTGTPLFKDDEITSKVFGDYVSTYDFQRAVEDKATVPLYYDSRGETLGVATNDINERIAEKLEEIEISDINIRERLEKELKRDYHIITAEKRLNQIGKDFVDHYTTAWETGKAMFICIDKLTCVKMYELIEQYWAQKEEEVAELWKMAAGEEKDYLSNKLIWMKETKKAVIVSEEQGEVDKFKKWGFDIKPHRQLMKNGFELSDGTRIDVDSAFKREDHPFRIAIVCAMWLTGFDVPSLANLYLDKPLKAHTLMQAIARANRVNKDKNNGLIVDYCGILKNLRKALATFTGTGDTGRTGWPGPNEADPAITKEELIEELKQAILLVTDFLSERKASLDVIINSSGFERNKAIVTAKEAVNENDESRKKFEVMCREVFIKFKACLTIPAVNNYRSQYNAINIIYKSLQEDRDVADISDIIKQLHEVVDESVVVDPDKTKDSTKPYDISKIDFNRLRAEFNNTKKKNTTVQNLKTVIEKKLQQLVQKNPLRTNFQEHYEKIIAEYNKEKDRQHIEETFEALLKFVQGLDEEEARAMREGMDEETLAIYDLLVKPDLKFQEIQKIKKIAKELLKTLKEKLKDLYEWQDREPTRDDIKVLIRDFLWDEASGLPVDYYNQSDVDKKTEAVFYHVYRAYPTVPSPYYAFDIISAKSSS